MLQTIRSGPEWWVLPHRQRSRISCRKCSGAAFISCKSIVKTGCESGGYTMVTPSTHHGDTIGHHGVCYFPSVRRHLVRPAGAAVANIVPTGYLREELASPPRC